jgi:hypothetical protein
MKIYYTQTPYYPGENGKAKTTWESLTVEEQVFETNCQQFASAYRIEFQRNKALLLYNPRARLTWSVPHVGVCRSFAWATLTHAGMTDEQCEGHIDILINHHLVPKYDETGWFKMCTFAGTIHNNCCFCPENRTNRYSFVLRHWGEKNHDIIPFNNCLKRKAPDSWSGDSAIETFRRNN